MTKSTNFCDDLLKEYDDTEPIAIIQKLSDRDHIILKPSMYVGGISEIEKTVLLLNNDYFVFEEVVYVPGFLKIIDEIIDNSIDEAIRTKFKFSNKISISYKDGTFTITDNGRGLPQDIAHDGLPQAVIAFTEARAGSNFDEKTKANGIGTNGIGSFLTNVYSNTFTVITCNGKDTIKLESKNNAETYTYSIKKGGKQGTSVIFTPDLSKFNMTEISEVYFRIIENRCIHLAQSFPEITFNLDLKGSK